MSEFTDEELTCMWMAILMANNLPLTDFQRNLRIKIAKELDRRRNEKQS